MSELRTALPKITTPLPGPKAQALIERRVSKEAKEQCSKTLTATSSWTGSQA